MLTRKIIDLTRKFVGSRTVNDHTQGMLTEDHIYAKQFMDALVKLEHQLHGSGNPEEIAMGALKAGSEFYQAEWCGILDANLDVGVFTPFWWYTPVKDDQTTTLFREFEFIEGFPRWVDAVRNNYAIVVPDVEQIKETQSTEYESYQRLEVQAVIGAPYMKRSVGFVAIKNPQRFKDRPEFLQMISYVVVVEVNERKLIENVRANAPSQPVMGDMDVQINFFGGLEIITAQGKLSEADLKSPKGCRILVYLYLNRHRAMSAREIAENLWPEDDTDKAAGNIRALLYRFRQNTECLCDQNLIVTTPTGYQLNKELNIMSDCQQFENYCKAAKEVSGSVSKIELLEKAAMLYKGSLFPSATAEQWQIPYENQYRIQYMKVMNELLGLLNMEEEYSKLYQYSAVALNMDNSSIDFWYWNILALRQSGSAAIAKRELDMAKTVLPPEDYEKLTLSLQWNKKL